jgi:ABC-2 type transport system ATP-binding protein
MTQETIDFDPAAAQRSAQDVGDAPVVIEVRDVVKGFRVPERRIDTFRERASHPLTRLEYRTLEAIKGVSFDVRRGEFFGIVGQNGSGKSTLLKILASIYRADRGRIRIAGRLAPFIELGVGFNPELTARENNEINGVLMGLSRREARRRLDAVLDFAELQDFAELKLKNYSSGMLVRLAFAIMVQADADIMLIDEVLAVGDAAFSQKCMDVFHDRRRQGKTVVLVTHDMETVQSLCHRAMLMHEGELRFIGDPEDTAREYYRVNFGEVATEWARRNADEDITAVPNINTRLLEARLEDERGNPVDNIEEGAPIVFDALLEARRDLVAPLFGLHVMNEEPLIVFTVHRSLPEEHANRLAPGERVRIRGKIENPLLPGRYTLDCWVRHDHDGGEMNVQIVRLAEFLVYGTGSRQGLVSVRSEIEAIPEP